jgi:hypothetical protein
MVDIAESLTKNHLDRFYIYSLMVSVLIFSVTSVLLYTRYSVLLFYPILVITFAHYAGLSLLFYNNPHSNLQPSINIRLVNAGILISIVLLSLYTGPREGFPPEYFVVVITAAALLLYRIARKSDHWNILYILLLGVVIRANIWYSAPHFSRDPRLHVGITGFIRETGHMVPEYVDDYHSYPIPDIYSGTVSIVSGTDPKSALFLSIGLVGVIGIVFVFLFVRRTYNRNSDRMASYAAFLFSISAYELVLTAGPKPQTFATSLLLLTIFVVQIRSIEKRVLLISLIGLVLVFSHVLSPILLGLILAFYYISNILTSKSGFPLSCSVPERHNISFFLYASILLVLIIQRYHQVGHFRSMLLRLSSVFFPRGNVVQFASRRRPTTAVNVLIDVDPLLLQAGSFLLIGFLFGVSMITFLYYRILQKEAPVLKDPWAVMNGLLFPVFTLIFYSRATAARRAAPAIIAIMSPLVIYALFKFRVRWGKIGHLVIVALLLSGTFFGVANPGVYITDRDSGFQPLIYDSELYAINHFQDYVGPQIRHEDSIGYSDSYTASSIYFENIRSGDDTARAEYHSTHVRQINYLNMTSGLVAQTVKGNKRYLLYRTYYSRFLGVDPPETTNSIYDSGGAKVFT